MSLRVEHRVALDRLVDARIAERTAGEWMPRLQARRLPYAVVNDYAQALADPQVRHRALVRELEHPHSGTIRVVGTPWIMSRTRAHMRPPPLLGQHTREVLSDWLGLPAREADRFAGQPVPKDEPCT
jgi:crotonobetainyl-CoA:carnitine CoA-transferase CaiB-like acyl-CoA transferase